MTDSSRVQVLLSRLDPDLPMPRYSHPGDAGADLYARQDVQLAPGARVLVPVTGSLW
jgi:dUTP pyrophosphatase